jgi:hypothetical protein
MRAFLRVHPTFKYYVRNALMIDVACFAILSLMFAVVSPNSFLSVLPWLVLLGALSGPIMVFMTWVNVSAWGQ